MGSFGLFFTLFLLFLRFLPMIAMAEVKGVLASQMVTGGSANHIVPERARQAAGEATAL